MGDSQTDEVLNQWRPAIGGRGYGISGRVEGRFCRHSIEEIGARVEEREPGAPSVGIGRDL